MFDCLSHFYTMTAFTCKQTCTVAKYCYMYCFSLYSPLFCLIYWPELHGNHSCTTFKKLLRVSILSAPYKLSRQQKVPVLSKIRVLWNVMLCSGLNISRCFAKSHNLQFSSQNVHLRKTAFSRSGFGSVLPNPQIGGLPYVSYSNFVFSI